MVASEYVIYGARPYLDEVVAGDKPTDNVAPGTRYLDLDGVAWEFNGTAWIQVASATFGGAVGTVQQGNAGSDSWKVNDTRVATLYFQAAGDETVRNVKATAGVLVGFDIANPDAADYFLQIFDHAAVDVVLGTTAPAQSYLVPAGDGAGVYGSLSRIWSVPLDFATAISYAITTTPTGLTGPSTSCIVNAQYV